MHGREHAWKEVRAWQGSCMALGEGVWQRGMHGWCGRGACMGVCGRGACMAGACMAGEMATAADGMHPTGMHSCFNFVVSLFLVLFLRKSLTVTICIGEFVKLILFVHKKTSSCLAMSNT